MNFLKPKSKDNFIIVCEHCKAIVSFSEEDCYCSKSADVDGLLSGDIHNITRVFIRCPNCRNEQDVVTTFRHAKKDKGWF